MKRAQRTDYLFLAAAILAALTLAPIAFAGSVAMPDPKLTPGASDPTATAAKLCDRRFHTGDVRNVTQAEKKQVYAEYGRTPEPRVCCEVDHLVSLELGGTNDLANLWPQPYAPTPGAHQKDIVENWLHKQVCAGRISLKDAQHQIATDWFAVYRRMTSEQKEAALKAR